MLRPNSHPFYAKFDKLEQIEKFLDIYTLPRLNQEEIEHLNSPIMCNDIESVRQSLIKERLGAK